MNLTIMSKLLFTILLFFQAIAFAAPSLTQVNIVVDDSGSMCGSEKENGFHCQKGCNRINGALYALETVCGILISTEHTINISFLNDDYGRRKDKFQHSQAFTIDGTSLSSSGRQTVKSTTQTILSKESGILQSIEKDPGKGTPFINVEKAFKDLDSNTDADNKWLIILADGQFTGTKQQFDLNKRLEEFTSGTGIKIAMLQIGNENLNVTPVNDRIFFGQAQTSEEVPEKLAELVTQLSGKGVVKLEKGKIDFNIPLDFIDLQVFAQGSGISIGELKGRGKSIYPQINDQAELTSSNKNCDKSLQGIIAQYKLPKAEDTFPKGKYQLDLKQANITNIYYTPDIYPEVILKDSQGKTIKSGKTLDAGEEYRLAFVILNHKGKEIKDLSHANLQIKEWRLSYQDNSGHTIKINPSNPILQIPLDLNTLTIDAAVDLVV